MVYIAFGILSLYRHFAHVAHVEYATMLAYGLMFVDDARVLDRHVEASKRTDECPEVYVFVIQTGSFVFHFFILDF